MKTYPRALEFAMPWLVIVGLLVFWQIVVRAFDIAPFVLPAPSAITTAVAAKAAPFSPDRQVPRP